MQCLRQKKFAMTDNSLDRMLLFQVSELGKMGRNAARNLD
jgi:hypothetical protein